MARMGAKTFIEKYVKMPIFVTSKNFLETNKHRMKIFRLLILSTAALLFSVGLQAQAALKKADKYFENRAYYEAARQYKAAEPSVKNLEDKARLFFQIGESNRLISNHQAALEWYEKAITAQYYKTNPEVYYSYATCLQELERFEDAIAQYNKYTERGGEKSKAAAQIKAAEDGAKKKAAKSKVIVENMVEWNTPFYEFGPIFADKKGEQAIITSSRQASSGQRTDLITGESFMDLFFSDKDKKGKWSTPQQLGGGINTIHNEGAAAFDKGFKNMYYTSCVYESERLLFACDIMMAKKQGNNYTSPINLNLIDRNENDTSVVGHPALTPDDAYLFFASDMPGGKGGKDIWYVSYDKKSGNWGKPTNLAAINTKGDDMFPYFDDNGNLYFSSDGRGGLGGLDIFKAEKTGDLTFGTPVAFEYPINSSSDDFGFVLESEGGDGKAFSGYFTSSRPGGKGKDDVYRFSEPPLQFTFAGNAYDKENGSSIADAEISLVGSSANGDPITITKKTDGNGGFSFDEKELKAGYNYTVKVEKDQFIGASGTFSTVGLKSSTNFAKEYFLMPIIKDKEYDMPTVLYVFAKADLLIDEQVNSADSLNYLLDLLKDNPRMVVQLEAHTDARGSDKDNKALSEKRAKTCVDYLISKGIEADRLVAVGKGESEPRKLLKVTNGFPAGTVLTEAYINKLPKDQQEAAHTLNRRTIFKVIGTNYIPKK
jgi:peptidoglycan-associated lipoprotein